MVSDFKEMFDWDEIETEENGDNFNIFKKSYGENSYVGLRVSKQKTQPPLICAAFCNGVNFYVTDVRNKSSGANVAYAYGGGFFAFCASPTAMPNNQYAYFGGISTCRNIHTGETGWCSFAQAYRANASIEAIDYYVLTKDTKVHDNYSFTDWCLTTNAKIGAATALHEPQTGNVSDKILLLTAIPDNLTSCIAPVIFNGVRYTRLGMMLVPAD